MNIRNRGSNTREIIAITVIALAHIDKGVDVVIKVIERLASTKVVGYAAMMFLASLIRGSPAAV